MKKQMKPGDLFNAHKKMAMKGKKKHKSTVIGSSMTPSAGKKYPTPEKLGWKADAPKAASPLSKGTLKMVQPSFLRGRNIKPLTVAGGRAVGKGFNKFKKTAMKKKAAKAMKCKLKHKHSKSCK